MAALSRRPELLAQLIKLNPNVEANPNYDEIMAYVLDKTINDIANYTHIAIASLPAELDQTIVGMAQQLLETHQLLASSAEPMNDVQSLSEGDTAVIFKSLSATLLELQSVNAISDNYLMVLNQFRQVKY
ncbi:hypothetical protein [Lactiplantibacillus herbarum]|uniref:hypothetical protein n=1 Tax=Lactiplantibacillus herbarum TaxID=1670446 RepID=UPI00064FFB75|nr:hypothetical protein [Lactiplantibacillus herbarum]